MHGCELGVASTVCKTEDLVANFPIRFPIGWWFRADLLDDATKFESLPSIGNMSVK